MRSRISAVTAASALAFAMSLDSAAYANFIQNGDFSDPWGAGPGYAFTSYYAGQSFNGWTATGDGVDLWGNYYQAPPSGGGMLDLNRNTAGGVYQQLNLTAGSYVLNFYFSGEPGRAPNLKTMNVSIGDFNQNFSFDTTGHDGSNMGWILEIAYFNAVGPTRLSFTSLNDCYTCTRGPMIGGVSVEAAPLSGVPLPSTLSLFAGSLGVLGVLGLRKRRKAAA